MIVALHILNPVFLQNWETLFQLNHWGLWMMLEMQNWLKVELQPVWKSFGLIHIVRIALIPTSLEHTVGNFAKILTMFWHGISFSNLQESQIVRNHLEWIQNKSLSSSPMKIQIMDGKMTENLKFESPLRKVKKFCPFFLFIFKFFAQNWVSLILTIFWYLVLLFRNQIKHAEIVSCYW